MPGTDTASDRILQNRGSRPQIHFRAAVPRQNEMKKIQTKIMLLVILGAMGVSIISTVLSTAISRNSTLSALEQTLRETTDLAALASRHMISTYTLTVAEIASSPILTSPEISLSDKQAFIQTKVDAYYMQFGGMADARGYDSVHDKDISQEPFFQAALEGQSYMSAPYSENNSMYLVVSAPILTDGKVQGVVYFHCDTNILQSIINEIQIGENGDAYILDKNGTTIAALDTDEVLRQENLIREMAANPHDRYIQELGSIEQKMVSGESGVGKYTYPEDNTNYIQGYAPIPGTDGWSVGVTISEDEFLHYAYVGNNIQLGAGIVLCIVVILISAFVCRSVTGPVVKCAQRLRALSEGDLNSPLPQAAGRDETRILADSTAHLVRNFKAMVEEINAMLSNIANGNLRTCSLKASYPGDFQSLKSDLMTIHEKLNHTLSGISEATAHVSASSAQVADSSAALSQGSTEQASSVVQLSSTLSDMDQDAKKTALLAEQAKTAMDDAYVRLQESSAHIDGLNSAMELITSTSGEIRHIIDTIKDIAFQTNILALNASVEAARAGTAGKGFSVVANEVRELASKSDEAAKATMELIHRSIAAVDSGSQAVAKVTSSVSQIAELSEQAASQMDVMAEAVERQTDSINQVSTAVSQISEVVQSNSATAQESAATSEELSQQAAVLNRLVGGFTLCRQPESGMPF